MITDRIPITGLKSYFVKLTDHTDINLATGAQKHFRTEELHEGKQLQIAGIQLLIESNDLKPFLYFQFDHENPTAAPEPPRMPEPILRVAVVKEMFTDLFADPYSHRVHNIAGFLDFKEGSIENGRVMEVDGVPTIVSTGQGVCKWTSKEYTMPEPITIDSVAWELATAKLASPDSFHYFIKISGKKKNGALFNIEMGTAAAMLKANAIRARENFLVDEVKSFQVVFVAKVFEDSYINERHLPGFEENIGRPLLKAINLLELVQSAYEFYSLIELKAFCSDFYLFEVPGPEIKRMNAVLDLNAVLVHSYNQKIVNDSIYDASSRFEHIELSILHRGFINVEARILGETFLKIT